MEPATDGAVLQEVFESAPAPILILNPESVAIRRANPAVSDLLGIDRTDLVGRQPSTFDREPSPEEGGEGAFAEAVAAGAAHAEWPVTDSDDDPCTLHLDLVQTAIEGRSSVIAYGRDVSRGSAPLGRIEQSEQLETLVENLPVVVFTLSPDGVFTHSTGKGLDALGLEPGDLEGASVFDVYGDNPDIVNAARRALDGEEIRITQSVDDLVFETWYRPVTADGTVTQVVGVARDITALKQRGRRVEALSEATNELLYTHTQAAVAERVTEIAREILDRSLAALWTYESDEDVLSPLAATADGTAIVDGDTVAPLPEIDSGTAEKAIFEAGESTVVDDYQALDASAAPDSPLRTVLWLPLDTHGLLCIGSHEHAPFDEEERLLLEILASTATAALDRAAHEQAIDAQREELAQSNQALERRRDQMDFFNSILRHDILNGMNVIQARADLLESSLEGEELAYTETIVEWSEDIIELTQKVRTVLQTIAGDGETETAPMALAPTVEAAAERAASMDETADFHVSVDETIVVSADELLGDVFGNIFTNAVEHASQAESTGPTVAVTAEVTADTVLVRVADDGPGVPESAREGIFERGQKGEDSSGTGFGLYFVDAMVRSYGGTVGVEKSEAAGATFVVELPRVG